MPSAIYIPIYLDDESLSDKDFLLEEQGPNETPGLNSFCTIPKPDCTELDVKKCLEETCLEEECLDSKNKICVVQNTPTIQASNFSHTKIAWCEESAVTSEEDDTISTATCSATVTSVGNATLDTLEVYQINDDDIQFNYRGPKVLPKNETPCSICMANTIGSVRSRKLLKVLFDSGSSACLIKNQLCPPVLSQRILPIQKR